jgi:N6-adenosine-specific RNA methylase IME4
MLKIKEEFKKLIPPLTAEEFKQLETNCLEEGIRDAIVTWNGFIIDGHNRYKIATDWSLNYKTIEKSFDSEEAVKEWMIINQFGRRNLSNYQRSVLALELEEIFEKKAKENLRLAAEKTNTGFVKSQKAVSLFEEKPIQQQPIEIKPVNTIKELSKISGIGEQTISRVKVIEQKAAPEIKEKLSTGEISINQAYQDIKKEEKIKERTEYIEQQKKEIAENKLPPLTGLYDIISVDPPWNYGREYHPENSRIANPYPEMSIDEIKAIKLPFSDNSIIFLWTTHKFLPDSFDILKHWGFEYKATLVWNKEKIGMGSWFRMQCEFCLFAIKGNPFWNNTTERDIIIESRREHSRKPDSFFDMIDKICIGRKLEYFSREKRNGWDIFGNDINKF